MSSEYSVGMQARVAAEGIVAQLVGDPDYRRRLLHDPIRALNAAGLSPHMDIGGPEYPSQTARPRKCTHTACDGRPTCRITCNSTCRKNTCAVTRKAPS